MGLLGDSFDDPRSQAIMALSGGLLQGNFGAGLLGANDAFLRAKQAQSQQQMQQLHLQALQGQLEDARRQREQQAKLDEAARNSFITPGKANAMSMGPMPDGSAVPQVQPGFNPQSYLRALYQADPQKAVAFQQAIAKDNSPLTVAPGASLVDRHTLKPVFTAPKEQTPSDISKLMAEMNGLPPGDPRRAIYMDAIRKATTHQPATTVNVSTEKSYGGEFGKLIAQQDAAAIEGARTAPQRIQTAQQVMRILDTQAPITGSGAETRLAVNKALATAGLVDGQSVKSTEDLASLLASQTLEAIKSSGLGGGQGFTDKDRQFLERARSGNIEMNAGTLRTLAAMNEKAARNSLGYGRQVASRLQGNKDLGWVTQGLDVKEPPPYAGPSVVRKPAQFAAPGVRFLGFE